MLQFISNQEVTNNNNSCQRCQEARTLMLVGGEYVGTTTMERNLAIPNNAEDVQTIFLTCPQKAGSW